MPTKPHIKHADEGWLLEYDSEIGRLVLGPFSAFKHAVRAIRQGVSTGVIYPAGNCRIIENCPVIPECLGLWKDGVFYVMSKRDGSILASHPTPPDWNPS